MSQEPAGSEDLKHRGVLTKRSIATWLVLLLVAAVAAGYISGVISAPAGFFFVQPRGAPRSQFDWGNAMLGATAAGTVLLAAFTAALAYTTSGDVSATWRVAQLTQEDQAARERPILLVTRTDVVATGDTREATEDGRLVNFLKITVAGQVRNIGLGPAVNVRLVAHYVGPETSIKPRSEDYVGLIPSLAPGDPPVGDNFEFLRPYDDADWTVDQLRNNHFRLDVTFQDRRLRPAGEAINLYHRQSQ